MRSTFKTFPALTLATRAIFQPNVEARLSGQLWSTFSPTCDPLTQFGS
jgi:hypothetical protein